MICLGPGKLVILPESSVELARRTGAAVVVVLLLEGFLCMDIELESVP